MTERHYRACTLCEAMCGLAIDTAQGTVTRIEGDPDDPLSRGYLCPKAMALKDLHEDPDRLRRPLRRRGAGHEEISWEEALDEAGAALRKIRARHGRDALAYYQGNPTVHNWGSLIYGLTFAKNLRTRNRFSASSVDQLPHMLAAREMFGHQLLMAVPDVDRTDFMLILGANPAVSNGSVMSAPGIAKRLRAIGQRGGSVVLIDPRRTETAELASTHHFIRPGADALLLMALVHTLFDEQLVRLGHLAPRVRGLRELETAAKTFAPETVAERVGMAATTMRELARKLARTERAVVYGRMGVCTQDFGALSAWLINVLNLITGHVDREGCAMFTQPAFDPISLWPKAERGHFATFRSRVRGLPEFSGELPAVTMAEEMETPGPGQIRGLITSAGNPVLSVPNGKRLARALSNLDFMLSIDFYLNETTRHAHIILPPTGPLEHDHYDLALNMFAVRNVAKYSPATFQPHPDARHDWEIFNALNYRLAASAPKRWLESKLAGLFGRLGPRGVFDPLLRLGPRGDRYGLTPRGLSLAALEEAPHGIDLGPLKPCLDKRLGTRPIELCPKVFLTDLARLTQSTTRPARDLMLIGRRELRSNNSWLHNSQRLLKGPSRCTLLMHPQDASARRLSDGERVDLCSRTGRVQLPLSITESVMPGVVSMPHGYGHGMPQTRLRVAAQNPGVSANDVTDEQRVDAITGNASLSGVPVEVRSARAEADGSEPAGRISKGGGLGKAAPG